VEDKTVLRVTGQPSPIIVEKIVDLLLKKKCDEALDLFDKMWDEKYDPVDLITAFFKVGRNMDHYDILKCVGMTHLRIVEGVNTRLQFYALFYDILSL
jgi:replication factor C subunit 2/4